MRKQLCKDHSENRACYDLCHLSKINRNTEFISGRMRIISYVSLAILFLPVYTVYKVQRRFENRNFPFRECTNYTLDIKEQNYAINAINAVTSRRVFGAKPTSLAKRTEFDYYCLHSYAFSEKTNRVTKDFNIIYL